MATLIETLTDLDSGETISNIILLDTELECYQAIVNKTAVAENAGYSVSENDPMLLISCDTTIDYQVNSKQPNPTTCATDGTIIKREDRTMNALEFLHAIEELIGRDLSSGEVKSAMEMWEDGYSVEHTSNLIMTADDHRRVYGCN